MSTIGTADLKPGDFVRCKTGHRSGTLYIIREVDGSQLHYTRATKAGNPDRRFGCGWSGFFNDFEWEVIHRGGQ